MANESHSEDSNDPLEQARKTLSESIERNLDRAGESASRLDRTLITLSAGALVLSMTFSGKVVPERCLLVILFLSWLCFIAGLIFVVLAMRSEQSSLERAVEKSKNSLELIDKNPSLARQVIANIPVAVPISIKEVNRNKRVALLNNSALIAFILGVVLLGTFIGASLWTTSHEMQPTYQSTPCLARVV